MTLTAARRKVVDEVRKAVQATSPRVMDPMAVCPRDGVVGLEEVRRLSIGRLPSAQCAVLGRSEDGFGSAGLRLAVFVLCRQQYPATGEALALLDVVERTLRAAIARNNRKLLPVRTRALYEPDLAREGSVTLWAVTATLPELAAIPDTTPEGGVFAAADQLLGPVLDRVLGTAPAPGTPETPDEKSLRIARRGMTARHRSTLLLGDALPFAAVRHSPGRETQRGAGAGQARFVDSENILRQQAVRGLIAWTATVTLWAGTDAQADTLAADLMRLLPAQWSYLGQSTAVRIGEVTPADYSELHGASRAVVEVRMQAVSPRGDAARVPVIRERGITTTCEISPRRSAT